MDDFAHHPTAVRETIRAVKPFYPGGRLIAVFEPRSATSRRNTFQRQFPAALAAADEVVIAPLHAPEAIPVDERLDLEGIVAGLEARRRPARVLELPQIAPFLAERCAPGDTVVIMSSGSFGGVHEQLLAALERRTGR